MNNVMISIIIPVYNSELTIERCLNSLANQTFSNIEVIVINDGSTDNSLKKIERYQNVISNLKIISQVNGGVSKARNEGIKLSQGRFIMFLDSDDYLDKNCCKVVIENIKNADMVIFGLNIYKNNIILRTPHLEDKNVYLKENIDNYWEIRKINLGPCNKLYKRDLITNLFDESMSLGEDTKFVIDYLKNVRGINVISQCMYNVCLDNEESLNRKYREDKLDQLIIIRNYENNFLKEMYQIYDSRIYNEYIYDIHVILHDTVKNNLPLKYIKENVNKLNYKSLKGYVQLKNKYYSLFFYLVSYKKYTCLYILLKIRILIERLKGV